MKIKKYIIILILTFIVTEADSQSLPIFIDGTYGDWENAIYSQEDNLSDGGEIDFTKFTVSNDENFLFIKLEFSEETDLSDNNDIYLDIDADNNPNTGWEVNGIGSEMDWNFGGKKGYFNIGNSYEYIYFSDIQLRFLPTVTSNVFEIAVGRNVKPNGVDYLFTGDTIKLCFTDYTVNGDNIPDEGNFFIYVFDNTPVPLIEPILTEKEDTALLRLMAYNIQHDFDNNIGGLDDPERIPGLKRIFQAVSPDIITINECWNVEISSAQNFLNTYLPLENDFGWYVNKSDGANITASRFPIIKTRRVYSGNSITACLIDLSEKGLENILVISAHFKCCDYDERRQKQADAVAAFILDCKTPGGVMDLPANTPFILMGDLNLVGLSQQLTTLITGDIQNTSIFGSPSSLDWDDSDLKDLISSQTDKRMAYTWRNDYSTYSPGRLDFMIYSNSVMQVEKAFILQTEVMPQERLELCGLEEFDTRNSSDHFPKVADFIMPIKEIDTIPKLNITGPAGDEVLIKNTDFLISWNKYLTETISIEYLNETDKSVTMIAEQVPANDLSYNWLVPQNINVLDSYKIIIKDINGSVSDTSKHFFISVAGNEISIFPNPCNGAFYIDFENNTEIKKLEIIDIKGDIVLEPTLVNNYRQRVDLSSFQDGMYFLRVSINDTIYYKKIVLIK